MIGGCVRACVPSTSIFECKTQPPLNPQVYFAWSSLRELRNVVAWPTQHIEKGECMTLGREHEGILPSSPSKGRVCMRLALSIRYTEFITIYRTPLQSSFLCGKQERMLLLRNENTRQSRCRWLNDHFTYIQELRRIFVKTFEHEERMGQYVVESLSPKQMSGFSLCSIGRMHLKNDSHPSIS